MYKTNNMNIMIKHLRTKKWLCVKEIGKVDKEVPLVHISRNLNLISQNCDHDDFQLQI